MSLHSSAPGWSFGQQSTINQAFRATLERFPNQRFLNFLDADAYTYREFDSACNELTHGLQALGVGQGMTVAGFLENRVEALLTWFAAMRLGGIYVPINPAFKGDFLRHQLEDSSATVLVAEPDLVEQLVPIASELTHLRVVMHRGVTPAMPVLPFAVKPLTQFMIAGRERIEAPCRPSDVATLLYTGGTTGPSKGCMIPHNALVNVAQSAVDQDMRTEHDIAWTCLPFTHSNALALTVLAQMLVGGTAAVSRRFSVSSFWDDVEKAGATIAGGLGTMMKFLADAPDSPSMLRYKGKLRVMRGAPFPPELRQRWRERFGVAQVGSNVYGLTETFMLCTLPRGVDAPPGSSGMRSPNFDVRIVNDRDEELPPGEAGEIICRPLRPNLMFKGYWNRPADTLRVWDNLWFHTGDVGKFDADGFFYYVDRKKDCVRRRGENISSYDVEVAFLKHPDVLEVAAHAVPSANGEDDLKVTVVRQAGSGLSEEQLARWSMERVPYFAVPRYIEFRDALPKSELGRVRKVELREQGRTPATWDFEESGIKLAKR
jgi:crotonobetaine/carnitine-CoA ligase